MNYRFANAGDCVLLGQLNHELIRDEGHRNPMGPLELTERMRAWIANEYRAVIFQRESEVLGYALFRERPDEIYLRQLFIVREQRRKGFGRRAMQILREEVWPKDKRLTVEVLVANEAAVRFWRAVGYKDYALTLEIIPDRRR